MYLKSQIQVGSDFFPIISSKDNSEKPVLLVCGGGPGIPQYFLEYLYPSVLDEFFYVVYFDYRGTGLFPKNELKANDMTTECYLADIKKLAEYLITKGNDNRIYILGHSFGSYMALLMARHYPAYFKGYIAMSQICNQHESECLALEYMIRWYSEHHQWIKLEKLKRYDIRNNEEDYRHYIYSSLRDSGMHEIGIGTTRIMKSPVKEIFFPSLKCNMYSIAERLTIWRRKFQATKFPVSTAAMNFNAFSEIESIDIPIYFVAGGHDYTCNVNLQKEYYNAIKAPEKHFFIFEKAAHSPLYECAEESRKVIRFILQSNL